VVGKSRTPIKSVLTPELSSKAAEKFTLDGRVLSVVRAVDREEAAKLKDAGKKKREDKRNLYLLNEGCKQKKPDK
jgi:nucleolar protein 4